uniref:Nuclear pore complex protein Nup214 n=1 Tax=Rhipicephalus zambeziensis TaxID=60191 RepID=A0A224YUV2_9ACAR
MACEQGATRPNPDFLFHPVRTVNVTAGAESVPAESVNLVAASSRFGLIFAAFDQGVKICTLEDIQNCDAEEGPGSKGPADSCPFRLLPTTGPVLLVALNADDTTLAVGLLRDGIPVADMYDVRGFAGQALETRPIATVRLSAEPGVTLQDFAWNPVVCEMFAVCLGNGSVSIYELSGESLKILGNIPSSAGGTALCWSPKGKQLVVGKKDGSLTQYKPNMQEARCIPPPLLSENSVLVLSVCWLAPTVFAAVYAPATRTADSQANLVIVTFTKTSPVAYTNFGEPCLQTGEHPKERFWLYHQPDWGILMCMSRNSIESAVFGCKSDDKMQWELWELDSHGRAEVPLRNKEETFPLGMAVSYNAQRNITSKTESWPPMPVLLVLSTCGGLSPFHMKNLARGAPSLVRAPEPLLPNGQRKPMSNPPQPQMQQAPQLLAPTTSTGFLPVGHAAASPAAVSAASRIRRPSVGSGAAPQLATTGAAGFPPFTSQPFSTATSFMPVASTSAAAAVASGSTAAPTSLFSSVQPSSATTAFSFGSSGGSVFSFGASGGGNAFSFAPAAVPPVARSTSTVSTSLSQGQFSMPVPSFSSVTTTSTPPAIGSIPSAAFTVPSATHTTSPAATVFSVPSAVSSTSTGFLFKTAGKDTMVSQGSSAPVPVVSQHMSVTAPMASAKETVGPSLQLKTSSPSAVAASEKPYKSEPSEETITTAMSDEIKEFGKEVKAFKEKSLSTVIKPAGSDASLMKMKKLGTALESTAECLKSDMEKTYSDVHGLRSLLFETFALLEEARTRYLRNRDPQFAGLLRDRDLDPISANRLSEARRLQRYVKEQLQEVHTRLDLDWEEQVAHSKNTKDKAELSSAEAIYRALRDCRNTAELLCKTVNSLETRLRKARMESKQRKLSPRPYWNEASDVTREEEVAALADCLLSTSLSLTPGRASGTAHAKPRRAALSAEKKSALAEYFGHREVSVIEPRVIDKQSESRLLSKLALVLQESVANDQAQKDEQATQPSTATSNEGQQHGSFLTHSTPAKSTTSSETRDAILTPKPFGLSEGATQSFRTSTPLVRTEAAASSGVPSGATLARTIPPEASRVPLTKVIEVSVQPSSSDSDHKGSAALAAMRLRDHSDLTITPLTMAPPEISSAAVTTVVTKPLPTRSEAIVTSKEAGSPSPFTAPMTQSEFKFKFGGQSSSGATTLPSAFSFGSTSSSTGVSGAPAQAPIFSSAKPSVIPQATAASTGFKFADTHTSKPGFVAVKPSSGPTFLPVSQASSLPSAAVSEERASNDGGPKGNTEPLYEDVTPPSSPTPDQGREAVVSTTHIPTSSAVSSLPSAVPAAGQAPAQATFSFVKSTTAASPFPGFGVTSSGPLFKHGFDQQGTTPGKSLFGNTSASSVSSAAAAFNFTLSSAKDKLTTGTPTTGSVFAPLQAKVAGSEDAHSPSGAALPSKDNSVKDATKPQLSFLPFGSSGLKQSAASSAGVSGTQVTVSTSPFQPISSVASQPESLNLTAAATFSAVASEAQALPKAASNGSSQTQAVSSTAPTSVSETPSIASPAPPVSPSSQASSPTGTVPSMQANVAAQVVPAMPSPLQTPSVPAEPGAAPLACTEAGFGKGPSSVLTVAPMAKTTGTTVFGQPATSTPATVSTALSFALGSATTPFASPVFGSQVATTSSQSPAQTGTTAVTTPAFSQAPTTTTAASPALVPHAFNVPQGTVASSTAPLSFGAQQTVATTTTTTSVPLTFGQAAATTTTTPVSAPSLFGQSTAGAGTNVSTMFGATTTSAASATGTPSIFGGTTFTSSTTPATTSSFWKPVASAAPMFAQSSAGQSVFGQAPTTAASPFGQQGGTTPSFGQTGGFGFGQTGAASTAASTSPFGQMVPTTATGGTSTSLFGQKSSFGSGSGQTPSLFGQSTFGQQSQEQQQQGSGSTLFGGGGSGFLSGLGAKPATDAASKNVFGGSSSFTSAGQTTNLFGNQGATSFKSSTFGSSMGSGAFSGSGSFSMGGGSVAQSGFGAFQQQQQQQPPQTPPKTAFGGPPAFGGSPTFGGPPQFGGSPTFGGSPSFGGAATFGAASAPQQSPQTQQSGFMMFGNVEGPTFGGLAAQSSPQQQGMSFGGFGTPGFGGSTPGFGNQSGQQGNPAPAFSQWRN